MLVWWDLVMFLLRCLLESMHFPASASIILWNCASSSFPAASWTLDYQSAGGHMLCHEEPKSCLFQDGYFYTETQCRIRRTSASGGNVRLSFLNVGGASTTHFVNLLAASHSLFVTRAISSPPCWLLFNPGPDCRVPLPLGVAHIYWWMAFSSLGYPPSGLLLGLPLRMPGVLIPAHDSSRRSRNCETRWDFIAVEILLY